MRPTISRLLTSSALFCLLVAGTTTASAVPADQRLEELTRALGLDEATPDPSYTQEGIRQLVDAVFRKVDRANVDQAATHLVGIQGIRCRRALVRHRMICTGVWNIDPQGGRDFANHLSDHLGTKLLAEGFVVEGWRRDYTAEEMLGLDHEIHTFSAHRAGGDWRVELQREERSAIESVPPGVIVELIVDRAE